MPYSGLYHFYFKVFRGNCAPIMCQCPIAGFIISTPLFWEPVFMRVSEPFFARIFLNCQTFKYNKVKNWAERKLYFKNTILQVHYLSFIIPLYMPLAINKISPVLRKGYLTTFIVNRNYNCLYYSPWKTRATNLPLYNQIKILLANYSEKLAGRLNHSHVHGYLLLPACFIII